MKSIRIAFLAVGGAVGLTLVVSHFCGCETVSGLQGLVVSPDYVQLTATSNTVDFTVEGSVSNELALPLAWSVSRPDLGYISQQSGWRALYTRHAPDGDNVVTVKDQYDNEGYARVRQIQGSGAIQLSKSEADSKTWTIAITASSGGPGEWWVHDPTVGTISSVGNGESAVYTIKEESESNDIYVRDSAGNIGSTTIP